MGLYKIAPFVLQHLVWIPTRLLLSTFCSLTIRDLEHIESIQASVIIASNHASELDPILIAACLPFYSRHLPLFFTSREKEFYRGMGWKKHIYGGILFTAWGACQVYVGLKNYEYALRNQLRLLRDGNTISIFPLGTRTSNINPDKARGGASFLAHTTNTPIIPVLIQGTERVTIRDFFLRRIKITVIFGKPIYPYEMFQRSPGITNKEYETASGLVMKNIALLK